MSDNDPKKQGLLPPRQVLKRLNWTQEYQRGPDESVDAPPIFSSAETEPSIDESISVDFGWPSLSTKGHRLEPTITDDETTEAFTPDMEELNSKLLDGSSVQSAQEAQESLNELSRIPRMLMNEPDLIWQRLNHREGYILSQIDGKTSYSDLFEIAGLPEDKTRRILIRLLRAGVIG